METKDITRHIIWALVISVGWWLLTWVFGLIGLGTYLRPILNLVFVFGLLFYAINVKGWMHGLIAGLIYAIVFLIVHIVVVLLLKNPLPGGEMLNFFGNVKYGVNDLTVGQWTTTNPGDWTAIFKWPEGIYLPFVGFLLFGAFIGWANDHK